MSEHTRRATSATLNAEYAHRDDSAVPTFCDNLDDTDELERQVKEQISLTLGETEPEDEPPAWLLQMSTDVKYVDWTHLVELDDLSLRFTSRSAAFTRLVFSSLKAHGIIAVEDLTGSLCGMNFYESRELQHVEGLQVPSHFRVLDHRLIEDHEVFSGYLQEAIWAYLRLGKFRTNLKSFSHLQKDWKQFISVLVDPTTSKTHSSALYGMVKLRAEQQVRLGQSQDRMAPCVADYPLLRGVRPLRITPPAEWFPERVRALSPRDIIPCMRDPELEVFMLGIGKALVGPTGTVPVGHTRPIVHTARSAIFLKGDPGTGKSQILNLLERTMSVYGYVVVRFDNLDERFTNGEVAKADLAEKDDSGQKDMDGVINGAKFKTMVTNSKVSDEKKFKDAIMIKSRCTIIGATNELSATVAYSTDEGNRSRLKVLEIMETSERDRQLSQCDNTHVWQGLQTLEQNALIAHLSLKLEVSEAVIMGWFYRLCADKFYAAIPTLEQIDKALECQLSTRIMASPTKSLVKAMKLAIALEGSNRYKALTREVFLHAVKALNCILMDSRSYSFLSELKKHWVSQSKDPFHTWGAFKYVRYETVASALQTGTVAVQQAATHNRKLTQNDLMKEVLSCIFTWNGLQVGPSPAEFIAAWNSTSVVSEVNHLVDSLSNTLPREVFTCDRGKAWFKPDFTPSEIEKERYTNWFINSPEIVAKAKEAFNNARN